MSSGACITVQLGQCGNQLGCVLNDTLFAHLTASVRGGGKTRRALRRYFAEAIPTNGAYVGGDAALMGDHDHDTARSPLSSSSAYLARSILVDMETKVVQRCLAHVGSNRSEEAKAGAGLSSASRRRRTPARGSGSKAARARHRSQEEQLPSYTWTYRPESAFVRHSGSGNNWAAGYNTHAMGENGAGGRIMEIARREVERSDYGVSAFLLLQSLAGGTGSGLGARVSELLRDDYGSRAVIANTLVAPYSVR